MITFLDCHYSHDVCYAGSCAVSDIHSDKPEKLMTLKYCNPDDYIPGEFYKRELPPTLELLSVITWEPSLLVIDGYVDLGLESPGLGRRLYMSINGKLPVIGIAKTRFKGAETAIEIFRGTSLKPLYVTSCGIDKSTAAHMVKNMHGKDRRPTLVVAVDQLVRGISNG